MKISSSGALHSECYSRSHMFHGAPVGVARVDYGTAVGLRAIQVRLRPYKTGTDRFTFHVDYLHCLCMETKDELVMVVVVVATVVVVGVTLHGIYAVCS